MKSPQWWGDTWALGRGTCVAGAALDAIGALDELRELVKGVQGICYGIRTVPFSMKLRFPIWGEQPLAPPVPDSATIGDLAVRLNDGARWTREAIADWIEREERLRGLWDDVAEDEDEDEEVALAAQ